jgi:hypothetical protein
VLLLYPEDGGNNFLQNTINYVSNYTLYILEAEFL